MSSRPLLQPACVIGKIGSGPAQDSGVPGDMSTTITSKITILSNLSMFSYSYSWTGTSPSGTITVQSSNDYTQDANGNVVNAGTWNTLPLSAPTTVSGNTGNGMIDCDAVGFYAVRTVYTPISGTGTLTAIFKGKVM